MDRVRREIFGEQQQQQQRPGNAPKPQEWNTICSEAILQGEMIQQMPFQQNGKYLCLACATNCSQGRQPQPQLTNNFTEPFQCQCKFIGTCVFEQNRQNDPSLKAKYETLREPLLEGMEAQILQLTANNVQPNPQLQSQFMGRISSQLSNIKQYEDEMTQAIALSVIPENIASKSDQVEQLKALLHWFKTDYFTWTDKPKCPRCDSNAAVENTGSAKPNALEKEGDAGVTELYRCKTCSTDIRFPRYNNVQTLIMERNGRCGEWANCFTGLCRALGHDTRFILDFTDHIWTEVYIKKEQRWVHMDPCENAYDSPKMYEQGWGKKLTYILAFSVDEVVDVTDRYILSKITNRMRRDQVPEEWLQGTLAQIREQIWMQHGGQGQVQELRQRYQQELQGMKAGLKACRPTNQAENTVRQTGTLEWREQRGELGTGGQAVVQPQAPRQEAPKPVVQQLMQRAQIETLVHRPDEELHLEKKQQETKLVEYLLKQLTSGCGKASCTNKESCVSANKSLKQDTQTKSIHQALVLLRAKKDKKC